MLVDLVLIMATGMLAAWPFGDAWSGHRWLVVVAAGVAIGALVALSGHLLRLGAWSTTLLLLLAFVVLGPGLAVPDLATSGLAPNATAVQGLLHGAIESWRDALTAPVPLGTAGAVLVVPFISALLAGLLAGVMVWRSRWPWAVALVMAALFVTAAAYGDFLAEHVLLRGLLLAVLLVVWLRMRTLRHIRAQWWRRALLTSAVVALAAGVAVVVTPPITDGSERRVLRDYVEPPFDPQDYPSPLSKYRKYVNSDAAKAKPLFSVQGLGKGALVRLATMDYYDGIVWNVAGGNDSPSDSGTFRRLRSDARASGEATEVAVTVLDPEYRDPWVPTVGDTDTVEIKGEPGRAQSDLVLNRETGTMASTAPIAPNTTFLLSSRVHTEPKPERILSAEIDTSASTPQPAMVPDELVTRVREWQGNNEFSGGAPGAWLTFLASSFRSRGFFSDGDGNVPAGHGFSRLALLTRPNTQPLGNDEQYAAAMALAAQAIRNHPARVVVGFRTPSDATADAVTVQGRDMAAWVEVKLEGLGWVAFDPTPPDQQILQRPKEDPNDEPQPQVLQPPQPPGEPKEAGANLQQGDGNKKPAFDLWGLVGDIVAVVVRVGLLLLLTVPLWGILAYKAIRRRRRRRAADPTTRLSGGWWELTDRARDLGLALPRSNTRQENGRVLLEAVPTSVQLAARADAHVFGAGQPDDAEVAAYWADVRTAVRQLPRSRPWWRRLLARFSHASVPWDDIRRRSRERWRRRGARLLALGSRLLPRRHPRPGKVKK